MSRKTKLIIQKVISSPIVPMILKGIDFAGSLASSEVVAITSKPINARKHDAEPAMIPSKPKGAKLLQFFGSE